MKFKLALLLSLLSISCASAATTNILGGTVIPIPQGGTGQTTQSGALNALLPSQSSNSGKCIKTDGSSASWGACSVVSVTAANSSIVINPTPGTGVFSIDLGTPTSTVLGGVKSQAAVSNNFLTGLSTSGQLSYAQPSFTNISGVITSSQLPYATSTTSGAVSIGSGLSVTSSGVLSSASLGPIYAPESLVDGTNRSTTLQTYLDLSATSGRQLILPAGTILATATFSSEVKVVGQGMLNGTTIKTPNSTNRSTLSSLNAGSLWGTATNAGVRNVQLSNLSIDGNRSNNTSGNCLDYYGQKPVFENVALLNCPENGLRTEWGPDGEDTYGMEGVMRHVVIDTTGKHGWLFNGPHDTQVSDVFVIDASQSSSGTYDAINMTAQNFSASNIHTWSREASNRVRYGLYQVPSSEANVSLLGGIFESGLLGSVFLSGNDNQMNGTTLMEYNLGAANSAAPLTLAGSFGNLIHGSIVCTGGSAMSGIKMGRSGALSGQNSIDVQMSGCASGVVDSTYSDGMSKINVVGYGNGSSPFYSGTLPATDTLIVKDADTFTSFTTEVSNIGGNQENTGGAPTVTSGSTNCGTSATIVGNNSNMLIIVGSSTNGAKCPVTFNTAQPWTNQPVCVCNNNTAVARPVYALISSKTTFNATAASTLTAGDKISCHCEGYR